MKLKIIIILICLSVFQAQAESLSGTVSKGSSSIRYKVDLGTGEYSIDLKNAYNPKIVISTNDLEKINCQNEEAIVRGAAGGFSVSDYKRDPIKIGLSISDVTMSSIERKITTDISQKGYPAVRLKRTTSFYLVLPKLEFEWDSDALSIKARANISQLLQERFRSFVNDGGTFENYNNLEAAYMDMPIHIFVCDLLQKKVVIKWSSTIEVKNERKKESTFSKNQIVGLSNYLLTNTDKLKNSADQVSSMDEYTKKIIKSSALLAFGLAKQGFDAGIINSINFDWMFDKMFNYPSLFPKKLTDSDIQEIRSMTTDITSINAEDIKLVEKEIKIEVLK